MHSELTVIICTHNRAAQLEKCLEALLHQSVEDESFEILVVDNGSRDETPELISRYQARSPQLRGVREEQIGLSHARNRGIEASHGEWVAYLDDDAIPHPDWAERLLARIREGNLDGIGGLYQPYFDAEPPAWYLDQYNSNYWMLRGKVHSYTLTPSDPKLSGGNCAFKRKLLVELGGFRADLGMCGGRLGYAEEVELQDRMLAAGYRLGFDANIRMDHHTPEYKQRLSWFLMRSFSKGRDQAGVDVGRHPDPWQRFFHTFGRAAGVAIRDELRAIVTSAHEVAKGNWRWQNCMIATCHPVTSFLGRIFGYLRGPQSR